MIQDFRVEDYRGIAGLTLRGLRAVNLVTGVNGAGKTALLEALWAYHGRFFPQNLWNRHVQRTVRPPVNPVSDLARAGVALAGTEDGRPSSVRVTFESGAAHVVDGGNGTAEGNGVRETLVEPSEKPVALHLEPARIDGRLRLHLDGQDIHGPLRPFRPPTGSGVVLVPVPARSVPRPLGIIDLPSTTFDLSEENINRYSAIVRQGQKEEIKQRLRLILPLVDDLEIVTTDDGAPYLMATTKEAERMALQSLGGGMMRLFRIFVHFYGASAGGVLLLDEVENGLHYSVLPKLWRDIRAMAVEFSVQVFATTHSMECVRAAVTAFEDSREDLAVLGLYRPDDEDGARAVMYADDHLAGAMETGMELR